MNYPHYGSEWQSPTGDGSGESAAWTDRAAPSGAATAGDWVPPPSRTRNGHITVFSGGSAFNPVSTFLAKLTQKVSYVLPMSDDGGSTAEIMRVLGGPAIGDIRSRLLRLACPNTRSSEASLSLLQHRLPPGETAAVLKWRKIVTGDDPLWDDIDVAFKDIMHGFLMNFDKHVTEAAVPFKFAKGSIGNFFFTGARLFFGSLAAAILLWKMISNIPTCTEVLPVVDSQTPLILAAQLGDAQNTKIVGQNVISHPEPAPAEVDETPPTSPTRILSPPTTTTTTTLHTVSSAVDKSGSGKQALPNGSRIKRIFYVDNEGTEYSPTPSEGVLRALQSSQVIVYAMGSLYTSLAPSLVLPGIGDIVRQKQCRKVLLLNGSYDRESDGLTASEFVWAVVNALANNRDDRGPTDDAALRPSDYVTDLVAPQGGQVGIDLENLQKMGVRLHMITARSKVTSDLDWERGPDGELWTPPPEDELFDLYSPQKQSRSRLSHRQSQKRSSSITSPDECVYFDEHTLAKKIFEFSKR